MRHLALWLIAAFAAMPAAAADEPAEVKLRARGDGWELADTRGMTLYISIDDYEAGRSECFDECIVQWPPLKAPADAKAFGDWSLVEREDGIRQWAFRGQPLYTYSGDVAAGDSYGDGQLNLWYVAFKPIMTPPELSVIKSNIGQILVEAPKNLTVYVSDKDKPGTSACEGACIKTWVPVRAPGAANAKGDWSIIDRSDGARQWAYKGKALYRFAEDAQPGSTLGDGADKTWHALVLEPPPPLPSWVRIRPSDAGELFTDAEGKTLYQFVQQPRGGRARIRRNRETIVESGGAEQQAEAAAEQQRQRQRRPPEPAPPIFTPVTMETTGEAKPVGNWRIVTHNGREQWAYKGLPLFTNNFDTMPGDLKGSRGGDRRFHTIMRNGEQMQGTGQ